MSLFLRFERFDPHPCAIGQSGFRRQFDDAIFDCSRIAHVLSIIHDRVNSNLNFIEFMKSRSGVSVERRIFLHLFKDGTVLHFQFETLCRGGATHFLRGIKRVPRHSEVTADEFDLIDFAGF